MQCSLKTPFKKDNHFMKKCINSKFYNLQCCTEFFKKQLFATKFVF